MIVSKLKSVISIIVGCTVSVSSIAITSFVLRDLASVVPI